MLNKLGRSSIYYDIVGHDKGLEILRGSFVTCVASKKSMSTIEIPQEFRSSMEKNIEPASPSSSAKIRADFIDLERV